MTVAKLVHDRTEKRTHFALLDYCCAPRREKRARREQASQHNSPLHCSRIAA